MNIKWQQKLSSRKFWAAVAGWLTSLLTIFNMSENSAAQVVAVVTGIGALMVYILGESIVDASRETSETEDSENERD